jgi:hypothetical protein
MSFPERRLSRRDFLKLAGLSAGALALQPLIPGTLVSRAESGAGLPKFPAGDLLGRNCSGGKIEIKVRPDAGAPTASEIFEDTVLPWLREVNALAPDYNRINQRWVETPDGYVYAADFQPCLNLPNTPIAAQPAGQPGFWAEVTVPYVDLILANPPARSPGVIAQLAQGVQPRLYYSQVLWIDAIKTSDTGTIQYRFSEDGGRPPGVTGGSYGDLFWLEGTALRPLTPEDIAPIDPDVDPATKHIEVNLTYQTLSCLEGKSEVYFCRVSTGEAPGDTPVGDSYPIGRKALSIHMSGGNRNTGYDGPAISWTTLFISSIGDAIHAATWHNDFGTPRSHGCVNCRPEDAKWIFRWTQPTVTLDQSDITWTDSLKGSTHVAVKERLS